MKSLHHRTTKRRCPRCIRPIRNEQQICWRCQRTLDQLQHFFDDRDLPARRIVPFFSMVQRQQQMHAGTMARLRERNKRLLETVIPFSADIEKMGEFRAPVGEFTRSRPAFIAYRNLWNEIRGSLGG